MKRQKTEVRQRQIAQAALKVIAQQGLRRFTAATIAREVGISDGTLFRHFPDKAAIVAAALELAEATMFQGFPPAHPDPLERLGLFFQQRLDLVMSNPAIVKLIMSDQLALASGGLGAERVDEWKTRSAIFIRQCLLEAAGDGMLRQGVDIDALCLVVMGAILSIGMAGSVHATTDGADPSQVWNTLNILIRR